MAEADVTNPLTGTFQALWDALEESQTFCALVPPENRHKYAVFFEPNDDDTLSQSGTPKVSIVLEGFIMNPRVTSSSSLPELTFDVRVTTAYQSVVHTLNVIWAIVTALFAWHTTMTAAKSNTFPYIRCVRLLKGNHELVTAQGIKGWISALKVEIGLNLKTTDLETAP